MPVRQKQTVKKPSDLAEYVYTRLTDNALNQDFVSPKALEQLFEVLFYASLHSEEGELIRVSVIFFDADNPQLKERRFQPQDKFRFIPFNEPLRFDVKTLVKLAKAADPWSSSLAVYYDAKQQLVIHGMIDQAIHSQSYINYEIDSKPDQPGYFKASITGIGEIAVMAGFDMIATLKRDCLVTKYVNVFQTGPVGEVIDKLARSLNKDIRKYVQENYPEIEFEVPVRSNATLCRNSLSRILNHIKNYKHGGALLFTNEVKDLEIKYGISYDRLRSSMANFINAKIGISAETGDDDDLDENQNISMGRHRQIEALHARKRASASELKGAIRFVASQSCVDGLVLCDFNFSVQGFGVVIENVKIPEKIFTSDQANINPAKLTEHRTDRFGTRHRSMFAYCDKYPGSLGFIISQDGDIRAVMKVEDRLIMWENIQTQKFLSNIIFRRPLGSSLVQKQLF